jgi:hypothetical protein
MEVVSQRPVARRYCHRCSPIRCFTTRIPCEDPSQVEHEVDISSNQSQVEAHQVILAHTPMKELQPEYQDASVLIVGRGRSLDAARAYGFSKAVSTQQLAAALGPDAVPFSTVPSQEALAAELQQPCPVEVSAGELLAIAVPPLAGCRGTLQLLFQAHPQGGAAAGTDPAAEERTSRSVVTERGCCRPAAQAQLAAPSERCWYSRIRMTGSEICSSAAMSCCTEVSCQAPFCQGSRSLQGRGMVPRQLPRRSKCQSTSRRTICSGPTPSQLRALASARSGALCQRCTRSAVARG